MPEVVAKRSTSVATTLATVAGPACLAASLMVPAPGGLDDSAWRLVGVVLWMVIWWTAEVVPVPVTALIPAVAFPSLSIASDSVVMSSYGHPLVFLFLGGFLLAQGLTQWNLHRRFAVAVLQFVGPKPDRIVLGFLCSGALLSMWISNTATAVMLLPVGVATSTVVAQTLPEAEALRFRTATLLAIAYGCTIGGVATLIGSPPNALLAGFLQSEYGYRLGFAEWMALGVPYSIAMLPLAWLWLTRVAFRVGGGNGSDVRALLTAERKKLGPMSRPEYSVLFVFAATVLAWLLRPLINNVSGGNLSDTTIALVGGSSLFLIPTATTRKRLLTWRHAVKLPWGVLLLFGGGLSLADAFARTGLAHALASWMPQMQSLLLTISLVAGAVLILTELASNTAVAAAFFPVLAALTAEWNENPLALLLPVALAASGAFMLPVATPPNAVVFAHEGLRVRDMARAGFVLNVLSFCGVLAAMGLLATRLFDIEPGVVPKWATR